MHSVIQPSDLCVDNRQFLMVWFAVNNLRMYKIWNKELFTYIINDFDYTERCIVWLQFLWFFSQFIDVNVEIVFYK
jgi:hypothetical protein